MTTNLGPTLVAKPEVLRGGRGMRELLSRAVGMRGCRRGTGGASVVAMLYGGCSMEGFRVVEEAEWCTSGVPVVRLN